MVRNITYQKVNNIIVFVASQAVFSPTSTAGKIVAENTLELGGKCNVHIKDRNKMKCAQTKQATSLMFIHRE